MHTVTFLESCATDMIKSADELAENEKKKVVFFFDKLRFEDRRRRRKERKGKKMK